jgi:iron complex outermembrane receptor protein
MNTFVRANNLFNKRYVGSVIVNDGNSRFFEPGPGFNVLAGVSLTMK